MLASEQIASAIREHMQFEDGIVTLDCTEIGLAVGMHPQRVGRWAEQAVKLLEQDGFRASYAGRLFIICGAEHVQ